MKKSIKNFNHFNPDCKRKDESLLLCCIIQKTFIYFQYSKRIAVRNLYIVLKLFHQHVNFTYCLRVCNIRTDTKKKIQTNNRISFINLVFYPLNHTDRQTNTTHTYTIMQRMRELIKSICFEGIKSFLAVQQNDFLMLFRCISGNKFDFN